MRRVFRIVFSRYGIVAIILVVIVVALALAQTRDETPLSGNSPTPSETSESGPPDQPTADDGVSTYDCEGEECYASEELPADAVDRAVTFAEAFLNPDGLEQEAWFQSIAPYMTEDRAEYMEQVDPDSIPAQSIEGEAVAEGDRVSIPLDVGTLVLRMTEGSNGWTGRDWLVAAIDWETPL